MALETVGLQQAVQPEAIKPSFLDNCHLPRRRSAVSRSLLSKANKPDPSPAAMLRLEILTSPGVLVATSQDLRLSSSATNSVLSSARTAVGTGWGKSVQTIARLHEVGLATTA
jgi:hypothetical protein